MTTQYQQTAEMQPQHVNQSQQTQTITLVTPRKKERVLLPCMHCKDSFRTECQLQVGFDFQLSFLHTVIVMPYSYMLINLEFKFFYLLSALFN